MLLVFALGVKPVNRPTKYILVPAIPTRAQVRVPNSSSDMLSPAARDPEPGLADTVILQAV